MSSPKRLARIAGLLYLLVGIFGGFAYGYVLASVYVPGDAAATASRVLANPGLVRVGIVADLFQATVFVFLALALYRLLQHVQRAAASAMVVLVGIATAIMCLNNVFQYAALLVATGGAYAAFGPAGTQALVLLLLDMQHYGFVIAQIFFGLWLVPLGYLAYSSRMFPKALGVLLIVAGASYLLDTLAQFLAPGLSAATHGFLALPPTLAEIWMLGYLLVKGVRSPAQAASPLPAVA